MILFEEQIYALFLIQKLGKVKFNPCLPYIKFFSRVVLSLRR